RSRTLTTHSSGRRSIAYVLPNVAAPAPLNSGVRHQVTYASEYRRSRVQPNADAAASVLRVHRLLGTVQFSRHSRNYLVGFVARVAKRWRHSRSCATRRFSGERTCSSRSWCLTTHSSGRRSVARVLTNLAAPAPLNSGVRHHESQHSFSRISRVGN